MKIICVNQSSITMPKKFIEQWVDLLQREYVKLKVDGHRSLGRRELTLVFLNVPEARKLNAQFRSKNYATDILSFTSEDDPRSLGEMILCPQVLTRQAREHGLTFKQELAYMLCHGVLHLLGYDHENSKKEAEVMYALQDKAFAQILGKLSSRRRKT
jgi:probable rRNA maturation factor